MKVMLLSSAEPIQISLLQKVLAENLDTKWIVFDPYGKTNSFKFRLVTVLKRIIFFSTDASWFAMLAKFRKELSGVSISPDLIVSDINDERVLQTIRYNKPELVVVSGTNLLKRNLIWEIRQHGEVINLHTGLSPYVNGGPNCTNWCLYNRDYHLIGTTVMFINEGIDSGDIIVSSTLDLKSFSRLKDLHIELIKLSHNLLLEVIRKFKNREKLPKIRQDTMQIKTKIFYTRQWNFWHSFIAWRNFYKFQFVKRFRRERIVYDVCTLPVKVELK